MKLDITFNHTQSKMNTDDKNWSIPVNRTALFRSIPRFVNDFDVNINGCQDEFSNSYVFVRWKNDSMNI